MTAALEVGEWSAALYPGTDPVPILQEAGWTPGRVWTGGKSRPHLDSIPNRPDRSQSLYLLSYRAHTLQAYTKFKCKNKNINIIIQYRRQKAAGHRIPQLLRKRKVQYSFQNNFLLFHILTQTNAVPTFPICFLSPTLILYSQLQLHNPRFSKHQNFINFMCAKWVTQLIHLHLDYMSSYV